MQRITKTKLDQLETGIGAVRKRADSFRAKVNALCVGDYRAADEAKIMKLTKARQDLSDACVLLEQAQAKVLGAKF